MTQPLAPADQAQIDSMTRATAAREEAVNLLVALIIDHWDSGCPGGHICLGPDACDAILEQLIIAPGRIGNLFQSSLRMIAEARIAERGWPV